ncbi:MAG: ATP-grasp domain-containing protein, partial [Thermoplasmata archaeon]
TNFSKHVARVNDAKNFIKIARRYFRRSDIIVVQKYIPTDFDWRIGVLNNHVIFGAKYHMVKGFWKIRRTIGGKVFWGEIEALEIDSIPKKVKKVALAATKNVGNGLYGVDLKTVNGNVYVIEVNDNPSIDAGYEDAANPEIYAKIITYLTGR